MLVVGIDADARRLAYATIDGGGLRAVATIARANQAGRIDARYDTALLCLMRNAADSGAVVYLEDVYLPTTGHTGRNVQGFKTLAVVQGEIRAVARRCGVPVELTSASAWHSTVLGFTKPRAELKAASMAKARTLAGQDLSEHEADAIGLALYGIEHERGRVPMPC